MYNEIQTIEKMPERVLYGNVVGVLKDRYQLKSLCKELTTLGIREVDVHNGSTGTKRLEIWKRTISQHFFGDMEGEMLRRYLDAVAKDLFVFAAVVVPELADKVAKTAKLQGASDIVHFGNSVVTNY